MSEKQNEKEKVVRIYGVKRRVVHKRMCYKVELAYFSSDRCENAVR